METIQELKEELVKNGKNPNGARVLNGEQKAREHARQVWKEQQEAQASKTIKLLSTVAKTMISAISTLFVLAIIVIGMIGGSIAVGWAEYEAVRVGFATIDPLHATEYSIAIVGFFVTLLFIRQLISHRMDRGPVVAFSIRNWVSHVQYMTGLQRNWKPALAQTKNMLTMIDWSIRLMMWVVAVFGVMGRGNDVISLYASDKPMVDGIYAIITEASLMDFLGVFGVLLMTVALMYSMDFIVYFIYNVFRTVAGDIDVIENFTGASMLEAEETAVKNYYKNLLVRLESSENSQSQSQSLSQNQNGSL